MTTIRLKAGRGKNDREKELDDREKELDAVYSEQDPSTGTRETAFHEQVRDILGLSPFERHGAIYAELRRLRKIADDAAVANAR